MAYEFIKLNQLPIAESAGEAAHAIIEDDGEIKRFPLNSGTGLADEVIKVEAVQVLDEESEEDYDEWKWEVETSIPVEEMIAKCEAGKNIALDVTAEFNEGDFSYSTHGVGLCSAVSIKKDGVKMAGLFGVCSGIVVSYYLEADRKEQYEDWYFYLGGF